ncbi:hypothetical protein [Bartonella raoultii]|uniref:hypothetical protein n=1 Tax=Bartonella raoultii TaxID=1457020 RepID=UPI001ABB59FE|nr:hypothetical protein [Bartonella raoultii]
MASLLQKLLFIIFLLVNGIYSVKHTYAEAFLTELSLSGLTLDEKYKRLKERLHAIEERIKFIEKIFADLTPSQIRTHNIEHDRLIQEQRDLNTEHYKLSSKLDDLAKEKIELAYRAHRAREYGVGEYEEKIAQVRKYLVSRNAYELGFSDGNTEHLSNRAVDEIIKFYPVFILSCKITESMLYSDVGPLLRKDFGWKEEYFSWAKDAINLIDPELMKQFKEIMLVSVSDFEKEITNSVRKMITHNPSNVRSAPLLCKSIRAIHNIMLPNKRKNILNRTVSHIKGWLNQR